MNCVFFSAFVGGLLTAVACFLLKLSYIISHLQSWLFCNSVLSDIYVELLTLDGDVCQERWSPVRVINSN